jgi:hypothetical protein
MSASEEFGLERLARRPVIDRILSEPDGKQSLDLIRNTVAKGCTDAELAHFLELCSAYGLDPFAREAWCVKSNTGRLLIMVGRDGLRKIAQRNGLELEGDVVHANDTFGYERRVDENGHPFHDVTHRVEAFDRGAILGSWCRAWERKTRIERGFFVAPLSEYLPANVPPQSPWNKQTSAMILAAAERQAARQATPLGGLLAEGEDESANASRTIAAGEGSGEGPGWGDMDPELAGRVIAVITRAQKAGLSLFADEPTIQMRLVGRPVDVVEQWLEDATAQLAIIEDPIVDADVVDEPEVSLEEAAERIDAMSRAAMTPAPDPDDEAQGRLA